MEKVKLRCERCQPNAGRDEEGVEHEKWAELEFPRECENLILRVHRFAQNLKPDGRPMLVERFAADGSAMEPGIVEEECRGKVTGFSAGRVGVAGTFWVTKAAVIHHGASIVAGHYTALTNEQGKEGDVRWLMKDDSTCSKVARFVSNMKGVYYLLLSRAQ